MVILLVILVGIISYKGFNDVVFNTKYIFDVDRILIAKEYFRMVSSGFLHANWIHFGFNMITLSSFGILSMTWFGFWGFCLIYFGSLIGGNLLSLYVHRNHGDYRAYGASGAVFGVVFSFIVMSPFAEFSFVLIPVGFPAWLMGLAYVGVSIWGIKKKVGNVGHEAHLGGAITGVLITALLSPSSVYTNLWIYALLGIPSIGFVFFVVKNPTYLMFEEISMSSYVLPLSRKGGMNPQEEVDKLLDKIGAKGYASLSKKEKNRLSELSDR